MSKNSIFHKKTRNRISTIITEIIFVISVHDECITSDLWQLQDFSENNSMKMNHRNGKIFHRVTQTEIFSNFQFWMKAEINGQRHEKQSNNDHRHWNERIRKLGGFTIKMVEIIGCEINWIWIWTYGTGE